MKLFKSFFSLSFLLISIACHSQSDKLLDCKILHNVKLKYADAPNRNDFVVINDNKHIEYLKNGTYYIKSDLNWINECEYILENVKPKNRAEKKAVHVKILNTKDSKYNFEYSFVGDAKKQFGSVTKL